MTARRNSVNISALSPYVRQLNAGKLAGITQTSQAEMPGMETSDAVSAVVRETQRRKRKGSGESKEDLFDFQLRSYGLPRFERQYPFAKEATGRQWKLDFANLEYKLAVEIEGLVVQRLAGELVVRGRHASITGFKEDCIKYATAAQLGWTVLRFEQSQVVDGTAIAFTQRVLYAKGWNPNE
jgi:very-short-patch-repair endonuclease